MTCIKTGARVYFPQYGQMLAADLFSVGNAIVVRTTRPDALELGEGYDTDHSTATHEVTSVEGGANEFWRDDLGVFVVPKENLVAL